MEVWRIAETICARDQPRGYSNDFVVDPVHTDGAFRVFILRIQSAAVGPLRGPTAANAATSLLSGHADAYDGGFSVAGFTVLSINFRRVAGALRGRLL